MKTFENPEIEIMTWEVADVITTSGDLDDDETPLLPASVG